jgi:hypothetical protein
MGMRALKAKATDKTSDLSPEEGPESVLAALKGYWKLAVLQG